MTKPEARMRAATNFCHSSFEIPSSIVIRASSFPSFIEKREHQFGFGDDGVVYHAMTFRFCQAFAARFGELGVDEDGVARQNRFAKFHFVRTHEIADAAGGFRQFKEQNARYLRHRLHLHHARHHGMAWEMSLKERLVNRDRFDANAFGFGFETENAIDHEKRETMR